MSDVVTRLHNIRDHLRSGRFGEREVWEADLDAAAAEIERLRDRETKLSERVIATKDYERLCTALQALADDASVPPWIRTLARRALEPKP
jgi:hypothetical protein